MSNFASYSTFLPSKLQKFSVLLAHFGTSCRAMERLDCQLPAFLTAVPLSKVSRRPQPTITPVPSSAPVRYRAAKSTRAVLGTPPGPVGSNDSYSQMVTGAALRSLLTRRAVSTVAFYLMEMNDSATRNWMLQFENFAERCDENKFEDDGTFLHNMLRAKPVTCTMNVGHPRGRFKRVFKFQIRPIDIATRILAVRIQLANEWARDLRCIEFENKEIERMELERMMVSDEKDLNSVKKNIFDYDNLEGNQTPLRYKNYGKLKLCVTQHAISRLEVMLRDTSNHDYMFFRSFRRSMEPLVSDEEFILALMAQMPTCKINPAYEVNPKRLAHALMVIRAQVATECIAVMNGIEAEQKLNERRCLENSLSLRTLGEDAASNIDASDEEKSKGIEDPAPFPIDWSSGV